MSLGGTQWEYEPGTPNRQSRIRINAMNYEARVAEIQATRANPETPQDVHEQLTQELNELVVRIVHRGAVISTPEY